jgi:hypothetical protein
MLVTDSPADVVDAARRRLRHWLFVALAALAVAGGVAAGMVVEPGPVCLAYGPGPVNNGKAVIAAGLALDVPEEGIVAGLTAAMQETGLLNLANPNVPESLTVAHDGLTADRNSVGILAQTPAWGPASALMSPAEAAAKFFAAAGDGWQSGRGWAASPDQVAARVQRSGYPETYTDKVSAARQFYRDHIGEVHATTCPSGGSVHAEALS